MADGCCTIRTEVEAWGEKITLTAELIVRVTPCINSDNQKDVVTQVISAAVTLGKGSAPKEYLWASMGPQLRAAIEAEINGKIYSDFSIDAVELEEELEGELA